MWMFQLQITLVPSHLEQQSPTFLAPGTSFVEDNFSTARVGGRGMVQVVLEAVVHVVMRALLSCPLLTSCCAAQFLTIEGWGPLI